MPPELSKKTSYEETIMLNIEQTILEKYPDFNQKPGGKQLIKFLKKLTYENEINQFIEENKHLRGFAFLDKSLEHYNFTYQVNNRSFNNVPAEGRVVIVANHPIGSLDGLALLKFIRSIRPDVRIVANEMLANVEPFQSLFLTVDNMSDKANHKELFKTMIKALENEEAVIIFPAGEVSRIRPNGVRDGKWKTVSSNWRKRPNRRFYRFTSTPETPLCFMVCPPCTNRWAR